MPPRYPPIAPRAPTSTPRIEAPARPTDLLNLDARPDEEGYAAALAALAADKRRFLDAGHPIKDALNLALQQPAGALLARYANAMRAWQAAQSAPLPSDDPTESPMPLAVDDDRPAIIAFTETQVAKAILGDQQAAQAVSDRVEGKAGQRRGDIDAETEAQRQRMRLVIGELVRDMSDRRRASTEAIEVEAQHIESDNSGT